MVAQVLAELEMTQHAETRVDKLSGGSASARRWHSNC